MSEKNSQEKFLRLKDVTKVIGCSGSSVMRMVDKGVFPKGIKLSERIVVWKESEIQEWIRDTIREKTSD